MQCNAVDKLKKIYKKVDRICKKHKDCDRHTIYHTLLCLEQPAIKRLEMSVRRANISIYSKRD